MLKRLEQELNRLFFLISKEEMRRNGRLKKRMIEMRKTLERLKAETRPKPQNWVNPIAEE